MFWQNRLPISIARFRVLCNFSLRTLSLITVPWWRFLDVCARICQRSAARSRKKTAKNKRKLVREREEQRKKIRKGREEEKNRQVGILLLAKTTNENKLFRSSSCLSLSFLRGTMSRDI